MFEQHSVTVPSLRYRFGHPPVQTPAKIFFYICPCLNSSTIKLVLIVVVKMQEADEQDNKAEEEDKEEVTSSHDVGVVK